jgi:hypothetical protein
VVQLALKTACVRMPDREACATELADALGRAPAATKLTLLEILGAVSGTKALQTIAATAKGNDPALQDASSDLLGKWMTIDAAPVLLDLAKSQNKYKVRAQRGYIRIARQFAMDDAERIEMCRTAYELPLQPAEQKLMLELFKQRAYLDTLKLAIKATKDYAGLKDEATEAVLVIAQKLGSKEPQVKDLLAEIELGKVKLEIVKAEYGAGANQKNVTETLREYAGDIQLITLPSANFNEAFGGDPAPGAVKQLKVQYRINDKAGETTFAENALIVLPTPMLFQPKNPEQYRIARGTSLVRRAAGSKALRRPGFCGTLKVRAFRKAYRPSHPPSAKQLLLRFRVYENLVLRDNFYFPIKNHLLIIRGR